MRKQPSNIVQPISIFLFFQLWANILAPNTPDASYKNEGPLLPTSTANLLCLLTIATFDSSFSANRRFHENELQLLQNLQASMLVAELTKKPNLDDDKLYKKITAEHRFHILLINGEDVEETEKQRKEKKSRLIAAFLSPPEEEMVRDEGGDRLFQYTWRSSVVQLLPDIAMINGGGMTPYLNSDSSMEFRPSNEPSTEQSTTFELSIRKGLVSVSGLANVPKVSSGSTNDAVNQDEKSSPLFEGDEDAAGSWAVRMRLTGLQCYCMPGMSSRIIRPSCKDSSH